MLDHRIIRPARASWTAAAALIALGVLALGCRIKRTIKSDEVEQIIGEWFTTLGVQATVTCPDGQEAKAGATFTCEAVEVAGEKFSILVTQKDDEGNIEYEVDGSLIDTNKVVEEAKAKLGGGVVVTCPKRIVLLRKVGDTTSCTLRDGDKQGTFEIKLKDVKTGRVSMEVKPT